MMEIQDLRLVWGWFSHEPNQTAVANKWISTEKTEGNKESALN